ncbi:ABC transporter permease [Vibrio natriegens]|uniref:ABC transporter permease n=1 Tax=Vibrio natriegens NBRC 15636 = ATCC 14048 = DSM 759 TaxID=1219067 RepID=A0AAN1CXM5_VIBNA|nr:FtsX-like permease family protein [Vibrio natriegens]ALR18340.1 ABC transporter permease [Vibrio natriegens NBRC 15636 = ATCC 14048 = DSM 759]ANQ14288.1 ABC transporter permease [Vibrio natriegens NBRC 15636 = ATCC 14048 = DSM 759]EPM40328.1 ABC transporter permease [Vibrio natriegens NBRC 15636 = ATCC 14048 = DSM 759]MDX6028772.1 FtsX-like permease family protein [Vibrio natriegens NBRC 15636 = ATCC 14048 = DSM 759]UUI14512.1 FtsX-like permease family protein [Vibrio natriegens]
MSALSSSNQSSAEQSAAQKHSSTKSLIRWSLGEIKQGSLWPISVALVLVIASIFALSALASRMEQVIVKQGKDALTADAVFVSANPLTESILSATESLETSQMTRFPTMAFSDNGMQLISVRAVDEQYPLMGDLVLTNNPSGRVKAGELWLDERILAQLDVKKGDTVTIGDADFIVSGAVLMEPGLSFNPFQQMPSAYIHQSDVAKTGAIQVGSRVQYRLFIKADNNTLKKLQDTTELSPSDRWRTQDSSSRSNEIFERTTQYLSLTVAIVIIMASTTLVLTCQNYVNSRTQTIAMLKSLGASRRWIEKWLFIQVAILLISASLVGLILGSGLEYLLRIPLKDLLPDPLPSYGVTPFLVSFISAVLITIPALGIPLLGLIKTPALEVLQQGKAQRSWKRMLLVLVPVIPLLILYANNTLVWIVLIGIAALFVVLALVSVSLTKLFASVSTQPAMKLALSRINRTPVTSGLQFGALALSLMLLSIIWLVRSDILADWERTLPADAPNVFALNIAEYELADYLETLDKNGVTRSQAFPIIRGRLTEINGQNVKDIEYEGEESDAIRRELNLTWGDSLPEYNEVLAGVWTNQASVSVESEVANELGLKLGDKLRFVINSQNFDVTVDTIRHVEWRDMKPNFYFIFSEDVMESLPGSYLISYRITEDNQSLLTSMSRAHPTVSVLDIRTMGEKIQALIQQIVSAITILALLGVVAGLLLIFTLLRLSLSQRQQEIRLYRTLGSSKKRISTTLWAEYGIMALIASCVAVFSAELCVAAVMTYGLELNAQIHPELWIALPLATFATLALVVMSLLKRLLTPINT